MRKCSRTKRNETAELIRCTSPRRQSSRDVVILYSKKLSHHGVCVINKTMPRAVFGQLTPVGVAENALTLTMVLPMLLAGYLMLLQRVLTNL